MGGVQAEHRVSVSNCEAFMGNTKQPKRIQKQFFVINNCRPGLLVQSGTNSQLLIKTNTGTVGQKADLVGRPQPRLRGLSEARRPAARWCQLWNAFLLENSPPISARGPDPDTTVQPLVAVGRPFPRERWAH